MKHVQYYLDYANDTAREEKYSAFLGTQAAAVMENAMNATDDVGSVWYAPNQGGSIFSPQASEAGMEALVSAAQVCLQTSSLRDVSLMCP